MRMPRWLKTLVTAGKNWNEDNAFKHSAAVSFYTLFSLAPITIIAVGGHSRWSGPEVVSLTESHGLHVGDAVPLGAWALVCYACWVIWRHLD